MAELWDGPIASSAERWCDHVVQRFLASYAIITALTHSVKLKRCIYIVLSLTSGATRHDINHGA